MPKFEVISAKDAPSVAKKQSPIAHELLAALSTLKKDEVLKLWTSGVRHQGVVSASKLKGALHCAVPPFSLCWSGGTNN
jgi:hypothetical protein